MFALLVKGLKARLAHLQQSLYINNWHTESEGGESKKLFIKTVLRNQNQRRQQHHVNHLEFT